ncbi:hypothetical protein Tco_0625335 [Tanacetum coccineum]|uniref:Uncharacterized protein n=1 Tax=Tanacetum coccineum TaxID=301880 RepID=A0ABQ4WGH4_9ASTR
MDEVDIEDLTIEQYLRLTQENQTPKKIEDMTIAEYVEYEKKMNENHISNKSYLPTYFSKSTPTHNPIWEFAHYFGLNQPDAEFDCDLEDMEEEVEYMTDDEVVMSEHNKENIIKSIKKEMKDDIMKKKIEASTANIGNETSSITSNEVDNDDDNTSTTASCLLPKELSPRSFLLPFKINNHSLYAITTLDAKDNIIPLNVYEYLGLDEFRGASTLENTIETNEPLGTIDILVIDKSTEALDPDEDPFRRCLDKYNWVFPKEIEQLANEYEIKIGEKWQVLEEIWTKCKRARSEDKD